MFWKDRWLNDFSLLQICSQPMGEEECETTVNGYWEEGRGWRWESFSSFLLCSALIQIASTSVDPSIIELGHLGWLDCNGDSFSVKLAYELGAGEMNKGSEMDGDCCGDYKLNSG